MKRLCCVTDLAFGFMPLERMDESFLRHFWVFASLRSGTGGGGSQDSAPLLGGGSLHDDDGPVVKGARARGSARKGQRGGSKVEKGRGHVVADDGQCEQRFSRPAKNGHAAMGFVES